MSIESDSAHFSPPLFLGARVSPACIFVYPLFLSFFRLLIFVCTPCLHFLPPRTFAGPDVDFPAVVPGGHLRLLRDEHQREEHAGVSLRHRRGEAWGGSGRRRQHLGGESHSSTERSHGRRKCSCVVRQYGPKNPWYGVRAWSYKRRWLTVFYLFLF